MGRYNDGMGLAEIAQSFSVQDESLANYAYLKNPNIASLSTFISQVYVNLFNRTPDEDGLSYWENEIKSGNHTIGEAIVDIISGARNSGDYNDLTTIQNKMAVALDFALKMTEANADWTDAVASQAGEVIVGVTDDQTTVDQATSDSTDYFENGGGVPEVTVVLTPDMDTVDNDATVVKGIVDGTDASNSTFSVADEINLLDSNNTTIRLSVIDNGTAGYATISNADNIDIYAATTGTINFNAGDWTNIGAVNLAGGRDGLSVTVDSLEDGVDLSIAANVAGDIEAFYQSGLTVELTNDGDGGISFIDGDVTINAESGAVAWAWFHGDTDITVGDVTGVGSNASTLGVYFTNSITGDVVVGDIALSDTGSGTVVASFDTISGDVTIGSVSLAVGDDGSANFNIGTDNVTGDVTVGDVSIAVGGHAEFNVYVKADADNIILGDFNVSGGDLSGTAANDAITDDFTVSGSGSGNIDVGNITISLGDAIAVSSFDAAYKLDVGVGQSAGSDLSIGDINLSIGSAIVTTSSTGAATASISLDVININATGDLSVGNVTITAGDNATVDVEVTQTGTASADVGNLTVGDVAVLMGDGADLSIDLKNTLNASTTTMDLGGMSIGDISVVAGTGATIDVSITQLLQGTSGGSMSDVVVGDVSVVGGINSEANVAFNVQNSANGDVADVTIGNVSISVDDGGNADFGVHVNATSGDIGNVSVGDLTLSIGASGSVTDEINYSITAANIGNVVIGNISVNLGDNAQWSGHYLTYDISATSGDIGDLSIGDRTFTMGDGAAFDTYSQWDIDANGDIGNITIGALNVDLAEGASVSELQYGTISATGDIASISWGDISANVAVSANLEGVLEFDINAGGDIGDITFGSDTVTLASANASGSNASFTYYDSMDISAVGDIGNVVFGDIVYNLGAYAYADSGVDRTIDAGGSIGDVTFGDVQLIAATSASFSDSWNINISGDGGIGNVSFGDVVMSGVDMKGTNDNNLMDVNLGVTASAGDIGSITLGDVLMSVIANSVSGTSMTLTLDIDASGNIGDITLGDISMVASGDYTTSQTADSVEDGSAKFTVDWNVSSFTGDVSVGTVSFHGGEAFSDAGNILSVDLGTIGADVTLAGITIEGDGSAVMGTNYVFNLATSNSGDITINDIKVDISATATGLYNLSDILTSVSAAGDVYLGTVDYGDYILTDDTVTAGVSIDVSGYLGTITVIGTERDDTITLNDEGNTVTGGAGDDTIDFATHDQDISSISGATDAVIDYVNDFEAGTSGGDILEIDANTAGSGAYTEKTATGYSNFISVALSAMTTNTGVDVVAVKVGSDTWVAVDEDGGNNIDSIIKLVGVSTASLNVADFNIT